MKTYTATSSKSARQGTVLILVVSMIGLLLLLLLGLMTLTNSRRDVTRDSTAAVLTDSLARGAVDQLVDELVGEMKAGSTVVTGTGPNNVRKELFQVTEAQHMLPTRVAKPAAPKWTSGNWDSSETLNLVKQSMGGQPFYDGGKVRTSTINTATMPSADGQKFAAIRWNTPRLMGDTFTLPENQTPDWTYVARNGDNPTKFSAPLKDRSTSTNVNYVVGRYAFQIYHTGGLLDLNAAGFHPTKTDVATVGKKGALLMADLRAIPGLDESTISDLVTWRNKGDWAKIADHGGLLEWGNQHGWRAPYATSKTNDNAFLGRADLIEYLKQKLGEPKAKQILPYLTSFSRTLGRPSNQPLAKRPKIRYDAGQGGNNAMGMDDDINPGARSATDGSLLAKRRFGLDQLELLADPTANEKRIKELFGLERKKDPGKPEYWVYEHGRNDDIIPIGSPDMGDRKGSPDFFETLKAAIHAGSLGVQHGNNQPNYTGMLASCNVNESSYPYRLGGVDGDLNYQIIKIGANIIDQYDGDSYPTVIQFNGEEFAGVESLPKIYALFGLYYQDLERAGMIPQGFSVTGDWIGSVRFNKLIQPRLWNPYVTAESDPAKTPGKFRLSATFLGQDPFVWTRHDKNNNYFSSQAHPWHNQRPDAGPQAGFLDSPVVFAYRWNYAPIGGENCGPAEAGNPAATLEGSILDFTLPASWGTTWPYPFSDPRILYKNDYPVSGITLSQGADSKGPVQYNSISKASLNGFNETADVIAGGFAAPYQVFGFPLGSGYHGPPVTVNRTGEIPTDPLVRVPPIPPESPPGTKLDFSVTMCGVAEQYGGLIKVTLSCEDGNGAWLDYDSAYLFGRNFDGFITNQAGTGGNKAGTVSKQQTKAFARFDPRTDRWGSIEIAGRPIIAKPDSGTFWIKTEWREGRPLCWGDHLKMDPYLSIADGLVPAANKLWTVDKNQNAYGEDSADPSGVAFNTSSSPYRYVDPDGVQRRASGAYWTSGSLDGQPMAASDPDGTFPFTPSDEVRSNRPVMLNRPFRSIAELGQVFRDTPWRNLDLFTVESGDAALLDYFCLHATEDKTGTALTPVTAEGSPIIAGRVNLNTPRPEVLAAMIQGVNREQNGTSGNTPFSDTSEVNKIAKGIVDYVYGSTPPRPLRDLSELVGYPVSDTQYEGLAETLGTLLSDNKDKKIQQRREAVLRALADGGQTSTWNLMIDLVTQSGHLTPAANALEQFIVQGEKRYWVHLAIDRSTGEVIDQQWEPVYE